MFNLLVWEFGLLFRRLYTKVTLPFRTKVTISIADEQVFCKDFVE